MLTATFGNTEDSHEDLGPESFRLRPAESRLSDRSLQRRRPQVGLPRRRHGRRQRFRQNTVPNPGQRGQLEGDQQDPGAGYPLFQGMLCFSFFNYKIYIF